MIEPALIFALGVMLSGLVALLGLPFVFRLAHRRAVTTLERSRPVSAAEIAAERDQLRAAHAVAVRVLEQRIEALEARLATAMGEAGRQAGRLIALEDRVVVDRDAIATAEQHLIEARRIADDAEATAGAQSVALLDATTLADRRRDDLETATARVAALEALLADQRVLLDDDAGRRAAGPAQARDAPAPGGEGRVPDDMVQLRAANIRLKNEQEILLASVAAATRERDRLRVQSDELRLRLEALDESAEEASEQTASDRQLTLTQAKAIAALEKRVAGRDETIATLKRRLADEQARHGPADPEQLPLFAPRPPAAEPRDTAALRQAVAALAADIVRFATPAGRPAPPK